jgi:stage V sporulation protein B
MSKQSFLYGALVLLVASLINRVIGFVYQILIIRLVHPEGIGLFNMIYPIYVMVLVMATWGIPVAIAKLVAEEVARGNLKGAYRIFSLSFGFIVVSSCLFTVLMVTGAPFMLEHFFPNPKVYYAFISLIPGVIIVSLCSAFRGFFQGLQQMTPTAVTQVMEQTVRVCSGLLIAYLLLPRGIEYAAIGISLGVVCGELVGFLVMLWIYLTRRPPVPRTGFLYLPESAGSVFGRVFSLGVPVTLTRFISTALMSAEAVLIPRRLQESGLSLAEATSVFGQLVGIAEALLFTPAIVTISLATALVPAISDAMAQNKMALVRARAEEALKYTIITGLPASVVFLMLPRDLCDLLFGYPEAGVALGILALNGPFLYLAQTSTGILQGLGRADSPFRNLLTASVFKLAGIYYLTALPAWGIRGTAYAIALSFVIMALLNLRDLHKIIGLRMSVVDCYLRPALAAAGMAAALWQTKVLLLQLTGIAAVAILGAVAVGSLVYIILLPVTGALTPGDVNRLKGIIFRDWRMG